MMAKYDRCGNEIKPGDPDYNEPNLTDIKSIGEIVDFLKLQANLRAPENDEGGILDDLAYELARRVAELEIP
jgi:hypothetical protein